MTVYVEYVIIDNFLIDYMLLRAATVSAGLKTDRLRLCIAAAMGAAFAILYPLLSLAAPLLAVLKAACGGLIVLVAVRSDSVRAYFIVLSLFLLYTFAAGGAITGIFSILGLNPSSEVSVALMVMPVYVMLKGAVSAVRRIWRGRISLNLRYKTIITVDAVTLSVCGFMDTGNALYAGDLPVIICDKRTAQKFFNGIKLPKMISIPVTTVNGKKTYPAFIAQRVVVFNQDKQVECGGAAICAVDRALERGCEVILHPALLWESQGQNKSLRQFDSNTRSIDENSNGGKNIKCL